MSKKKKKKTLWVSDEDVTSTFKNNLVYVFLKRQNKHASVGLNPPPAPGKKSHPGPATFPQQVNVQRRHLV